MEFEVKNIEQGIKKLSKKNIGIIIAGGAVVIGAVVFFMKSRNTTESTTDAIVDPNKNIATYDGQTAGEDVGARILESQKQTYTALSDALKTSQEYILSTTTDLINKEKTETDQQIENMGLSVERYRTQTADLFQKVTESIRSSAEATANKFATLDQKINNIPTYTPPPVVTYSPAPTPAPSYTPPTPATPISTPTAVEGTTAKQTYAGIYQDGKYVGNNGVGYNEAVSTAFESSLKTDKSAYNAEMARVDEVIANRKSLGLDTTLQEQYKAKIQQ